MVDNQYQSSLDRRTRAIKYAWVLSLSLLLIIPFVFLLDEVDQYANAMLFYQLLGYSALSIIISILSLVFIAPIFNILFDGVYRLLGVFNKDLMIPYNKDLISTVWTLFFMWAVSPPVILFYLVLLGCFSNFPSIEFLEYLTDSSSTFNILNIMIGLFGVISLMLLAWRSYAMDKRAHTAEDQKQIDQKNLELSEKRRLDERFSKALDILSKELNDSSYASHVGAIAELSQLAIDSKEHTQGCINAICACNQWMDGYTEVFLHQHHKVIFSSRKLSARDSILSVSVIFDKLNQEKRSQEALKGIMHILNKIGEQEVSKERLSSLNFSNKMLCGIDLGGATLDYVNLSGAYLTAANFTNASLRKANLSKANLKGVRFRRTQLQEAKIVEAKLMGASLINANLSGANLRGSALHGVNMIRTNLQGANLNTVALQGAYLRRVNLAGAILNKTNLNFCMLLQCNLYGTIIEKTEHNNIIFDDIRYKKSMDDRNFCNGENKNLLHRMQHAWHAIDHRIKPIQIHDFANASLIASKKVVHGSVARRNRNLEWYFKPGSTDKVKLYLMNHIDDLCDLFEAMSDNVENKDHQDFIKNTINPVQYRIINVFREYYFKDLQKHYFNLHADIRIILDDIKATIKPNIY